eukprot:7192999-Lingulodinium_polyedra.AAC.1
MEPICFARNGSTPCSRLPVHHPCRLRTWSGGTPATVAGSTRMASWVGRRLWPGTSTARRKRS